MWYLISIVVCYLLGMLCFRVLETEDIKDWLEYCDLDTTEKSRKIAGFIIMWIPIVNLGIFILYTLALLIAKIYKYVDKFF